MANVKIAVDQVLQGDFQIKSLNLLLVFQVNCPGCFIYALPLAETLYQKYGDRINVLGLSTAFEDFGLNTRDHTRDLLETGAVVGATKRYLQHQGHQANGQPIQFPIAFDQVGEAATLFDDADVEHICRQTPTFGTMDVAAQARLRHRVKQVLQNQALSARTFRLNQLQGTPSWLLFDGDSKILAQWFGHRAEAEVEAMLTQVLAAQPMALHTAT